MSQWNNSYAYNNQYQGGGNWNGDVNGQYVNQAYYPNRQYDPSNQYVSFGEFLSQMQGSSSSAPSAGNYNQYQNYPVNQQFEYQNVPSTSQNAPPDTYNNGTNVTHSDTESLAAPMQYKPATIDPYALNEMVIKSNLTPTATEFVPKGSTKPSSSTQNIKAESSKPTSARISRSNHGSSSETNWRERPQSAQQNGPKPNDLHRQENSHRNQDTYSRNNDSSYNHELSSRSQQSNGRNRNFESSSRNYESNNRYESNRNESSSRSYESNPHNERGQKSNSKSKNKDSDRTFYNSSINKGHDGRNGKEGSGRSRNYAGSQRVRPTERNIVEDEQYASSYVQFKEEKLDRLGKEHIASPVRNRNKGNAQGGMSYVHCNFHKSI